MFSIGIDVPKATLQIAVHEGDQWQSTTTPQALTHLATRLDRLLPDLVVLELGGGYERLVLEALWAADVPVALVPPRQVRTFILGLGIRAKADPLDARMLALFGFVTTPRRVLAPTPAQREVQDRVRLANQREHVRSAVVRTQMDRRLAALQAETAQIQAAIQARVATEPAWTRPREILISCPGIGAATAALLLSELPELGQADSKHLAGLVGVAFYTQHSGAGPERAHIEGGRAALWLPTTSAMRFNRAISRFAARLARDGKPHQVIVIACMRKLLHILTTMRRTDTVWTLSKVPTD